MKLRAVRVMLRHSSQEGHLCTRFLSSHTHFTSLHTIHDLEIFIEVKILFYQYIVSNVKS